MYFEKKNYTKNLKTVTWLVKATMNFTGEKLYLRFFLCQNSQFFIHRPSSSGLNVLANIFFLNVVETLGLIPGTLIEMTFFWYFVAKIVLTYCEEIVIENFF